MTKIRRFLPLLRRFLQFAGIGLTGLLVNALLLAVFTHRLRIYYLMSAALATVGSTLWNFTFTEAWVFADRRRRSGRLKRLGSFFVMNNLALVLVRWPIMFVLTSGMYVHYQISNLVSIALVLILRYALADQWIWRQATSGAGRRAGQGGEAARAENSLPATSPAPRLYAYAIHDLVTIVSEVALPELAAFRSERLRSEPAIRVRLAATRKSGPPLAPGAERIDYDEGLGPLGFWTQIEMGHPITVRVPAALKWSPHVLYTNLIEPILRWTLVEHGYALVHGACLAYGESAYLITARTDTGKTTTLLKILNHSRTAAHAPAFIADDLTLVSPTGYVLTYPKPLTISAHTVRAINATCLSLAERLFLPLQSRLHSRAGRRLAHSLARSLLPMATLNALVQAVVPPPKYFVEQLVPGVKSARTARLAGMFVIEREGDEVRELAAAEALQILMANGEDAYGFPPYPTLERALCRPNGHDLRAAEREIVASALRGTPATLIRSADAGWWWRILACLEAAPLAGVDPRAQSGRLHPQAKSL